MQRERQPMGMVIGLQADKVAEYKKLHADVWPEILSLISKCNITNYSIFLKEPENLLFAYWEYVGTDFHADSAKMLGNQKMVDWWKVCTPCQKPFDTRKEGEWWAMMEQVFYLS
ncbi:MAG: L-rhamnose mutarotase [Aestuariivirga sp.]